MTTVAVLGTGRMGSAMARALLRAGSDVHVWNRTAHRTAGLVVAGAVAFDSPGAAVQGVDVVIVVVFDTAAVLDVLERIAGELPRDAVVVQSATVGLDFEQVRDAAERLGIDLVDAPVLGSEASAEAGRVTVLAAGDEANRSRLAPVFGAFAEKVLWCGERPGAGSALKLVCNAWVAGLNALAAQSVALAEALGLPGSDFLAAVAGTAADSAYLHVGKPAATNDEGSRSRTDAFGKDLGLIGSAAAAHGVSTVLIGALAEVYDDASAAGIADLDHRDVAVVRRAFAAGPR